MEAKSEIKESSKEELLASDKKVSTNTKKCPNCGGEVVFDAKTQKVKCPFCKSGFDVEDTGNVSEKSIEELLDKAKVWKEVDVYQCKACGAKEIISKQDVSMLCPFCGTNSIVKVEEIAGLKPQGVVPFKLTKEDAEQSAKKWLKHKIWAPGKFKKSAMAENIHGVYNPVFTFDSETHSTYKGVLGEHYTVGSGKDQRTETRYFPIAGKKDLNFNDVIIQASTTMPYEVMQKIQPFDTDNAPQYNEQYLSGFSATTYNKDGKFCWNQAQGEMKEKIKSAILSKYHYDTIQSFELSTTFVNSTYKFLLVPVYVGHHRYNEKLYNFYVNGTNGKTYGKAPVSALKVIFAILIALVIVGGIVVLSMLGE